MNFSQKFVNYSCKKFKIGPRFAHLNRKEIIKSRARTSPTIFKSKFIHSFGKLDRFSLPKKIVNINETV